LIFDGNPKSRWPGIAPRSAINVRDQMFNGGFRRCGE